MNDVDDDSAIKGQKIKVAGFGFRSEAPLASLAQALDQLIKQYGAIDQLAAAHSMLPLVQQLGRLRSLEVIAVADAELSSAATLTHSARSIQARSTGSVAEAVALLAAGSGATLLGPRLISADRQATAAVAEGADQRNDAMTVHFIGAGPGAPDLLTLRGRDLIAACPVCLYAGSLVPEQILEHCPPGARVINTAPLSLDEILHEIQTAHAQGLDVARLHSGDLSVWSAMGEQLRRLRELDIPYSITPGVPSFAAAAATLGQELTLPGVAQSVVLTRTPGRASAMPSDETLANFARTGATLAIHLSIHNLAQVVESLTPYYGEQCPVAIVWRASWPDEWVVRGRLANIEGLIDNTMQRTALILVGPVLESEDFQESSLYAVGYDRRFRPQSADSPFATPTDKSDP